MQKYVKNPTYTNKFVKKRLLYSMLLLTALFCADAAHAQLKHNFGLTVEGAEWTMLTQESELQPSMGGAGGLGFAYELQKKHFIFQTGLGVLYGQSAFRTPNAIDSLPGAVDNDGEVFTYVYDMRNRRDNYTNIAAQIPLLIGGQWNRFYFLLGAKVTLNVIQNANVTGKLTTYGLYRQYDDFINMSEYQFFQDKPVAYQSKVNFNSLDIDGTAEIGFRLGYLPSATGFDVPKTRVQYRLALFADYGIFDLHRPAEKHAMTVPGLYNSQDMLSGLNMNDYLSTTNAAKQVNSLLVGIKFTMLFELPGPRYCVMCQDDRLRNRRGGTKIGDD